MTRVARSQFPAALLFLLLLPAGTASADDTVNGTSSIDVSVLDPGDSATVTLALQGQTILEATPTDVCIVLDESGSMNASEFNQEKSFATSLMSSLATAGLFDNGGRLAVLAFSTSARTILGLTTNLVSVLNATNSIVPLGGSTCIPCALDLARGLLMASNPGSNKVIILMTDGVNYPANNALLSQAIDLAQDAATVFAVGIGGGVNAAEINHIASDPDASHAFFPGSFGGLSLALNSLVSAVSLPGGTSIEVTATVASGFDVTLGAATKGSASLSGNVVTWTIPSLGDESASLSYTVAPTCDLSTGANDVHDSITYVDNEGNAVAFDVLAVDYAGCTPPTLGCSSTGPNSNSGFFQISASDDYDASVDVYINGFGPFHDGDVVKVTVAPGSTPKAQQKNGYVHLILDSAAVLTATDAAGNTASITCP